MAFFFYLARVAVSGVRLWVNDLLRYRELGPDHRHIFWKKAQAAAFLALMPAFLALGAAWRLARLAARAGTAGAPPEGARTG